jgi:hypothetical protein
MQCFLERAGFSLMFSGIYSCVNKKNSVVKEGRM